jgi:glutamine phosphoribosylpyrophosphate amidotransferase
VRYPTAGGASAKEAQPFFVNSPLGIFLIHNGNLTNTRHLRADLQSSASYFHRLLRTTSDSEVLLNVFADEIHRAHQRCVAEYPDVDPLDRKMQFVQEAGESLLQVRARCACRTMMCKAPPTRTHYHFVQCFAACSTSARSMTLALAACNLVRRLNICTGGCVPGF